MTQNNYFAEIRVGIHQLIQGKGEVPSFSTRNFYPPRFSHSSGLFPLIIFLSSSYLEVSKPLFLLSESEVFITFGLPSDILVLVTMILFSFWLIQLLTSSILLTATFLPALPGFQLILCLWPVLPQSANAPTLAFGVCSQGSISLHLPYFLLDLCFLFGDSFCFSYYNKNGHIILLT